MPFMALYVGVVNDFLLLKMENLASYWCGKCFLRLLSIYKDIGHVSLQWKYMDCFLFCGHLVFQCMHVFVLLFSYVIWVNDQIIEGMLWFKCIEKVMASVKIY